MPKAAVQGGGLLDRFHPAALYEQYAERSIEVPDIIEFTRSDRYLDRPTLYPRQGTLLKTIFLQDELFTSYDYAVLEEWSKDFDEENNTHGVQPDILERIRICKEQGRPWFREVLAVIGRRGSKGHLGGICAAYVTWNYLALSDPQGHYGIDRDKRLTAFTFAGKKEQAKREQWKDITNVILGAPCYGPYISRSLGESLTVYAPHDFRRLRKRQMRGVASDQDLASFEFLPKESTPMSGRGPASFMQHYDEMAHVDKRVASADAGEVYDSATPALDQFGVDAFIYEGSSPWQMMGKFYENWQKAVETEVDPASGTSVPAYPEMFMAQLTSWDPYIDWERSVHLGYSGHSRPMQAYDDSMKQLEKANPETFRVERRSKWATVLDAYLNPLRVKQVFEPWGDRTLIMQSQGILAITYEAHGDPGKVNDRFGFSIAHTEEGADGYRHVVFDLITFYEPGDPQWSKDEGLGPDGLPIRELDYVKVGEDLWTYVKAFAPQLLTFDQWNSGGFIDHIQHNLRKHPLPKRVDVQVKNTTRPMDWQRWEGFKVAINQGWVHAPFHEIAQQELLFVQDLGGKVDHPSSGPVQSKDVADTMVEVVSRLIGDQTNQYLAELLGGSVPRPGMQGGILQGREAPGHQSPPPPPGSRPSPQARDHEQQVFDALSNLTGAMGQRGFPPRPRR